MQTTRPCLISGASGAIGEAIARRLIAQGRPVALTHSPNGRPFELNDESATAAVRWYSIDVRDSKAISELVSKVKTDFGAPADLVYSAGITGDAAIGRVSDERWHDVIDTNLSGAFYFIREMGPGLMASGNGRVVLIGSVAASKGNPGQISYAAAKGGLEALAREVAVEWGRFKVTCNVVSPGFIRSRMLDSIPAEKLTRVAHSSPLRDMGEPADVAGIVTFLLSSEGRYITGQTYQVDGGLTAM